MYEERETSKSALDTMRGMLPWKLQYNMEMYIIQIVYKSKIKKSKTSEVHNVQKRNLKILEQISLEYEKP